MQFLAEYAYAPSLSNIFIWLRTLLQSCSWSDDPIKNNEEEEEGHVLFHWLLHGERTLGNYLFRQKCIEHVERRFFFQSADDSNEKEEEELEEEEEAEEVKEEEMILQVEDAGSAVASWQQGNNI